MPDSLVVLSFLSMGKESLWNLKKMISNKYYKKIIVVYVKKYSLGSHGRQKKQLELFEKYFSKHVKDDRVIFERVKYESELFGIGQKEKFVSVNNSTSVLEPLAKMQYCQLLCVPLIEKYSVGTMIIPMDYLEKLSDKEHFGDQSESYLFFNQLFCSILGGKISLKFNGACVPRIQKTRELLLIGWFQFVSSCYQSWNQFERRRKETQMSKSLNMCGKCFKCKIDIPLYKELKII